jgi:uncharacterized membrane protein
LRWQGLVALILGAMLLGCGVVLFVSAHWDEIGPGARYTLVMAMVAVFHLGGAWARENYRGLSTALHAVGTISMGAAIALVGQIFNIQEHWPAAILMWALAALAGWIFLGDEAQQTLTLLLFPSWILAEFCFAANVHFGEGRYVASFLMVWAALYLTLPLGSNRKIAGGILFAVAAVALVVGIVFSLVDMGGNWWGRPVLALHTRVWGWVDFSAVPLLLALFRPRKCLVPVAVAIVLAFALPWSERVFAAHYDPNMRYIYGRNEPNIITHAMVAAFAISIIWWGVRNASKALVNLGIVGFAVTVAWFYFSNLFDKMGRSLGLIGLGVLFLAGGWALEKMRRRLIGRMGSGTDSGGVPVEEGQ